MNHPIISFGKMISTTHYIMINLNIKDRKSLLVLHN